MGAKVTKRKRNHVVTVTTMWFNGQEVMTPHTFDLGPNMQPGCYVDGRVVHELIEETIYRAETWSPDYMQAGLPLRRRKSPDTGELEKVYLTFLKLSDAGHQVWKYCGKCFKGETTERYDYT